MKPQALLNTSVSLLGPSSPFPGCSNKKMIRETCENGTFLESVLPIVKAIPSLSGLAAASAQNTREYTA